jgi:hypothetical protein
LELPEFTVTDAGLPLVTAQLPGTSDNSTSCVPAETLVKVVVPLASTARLVPPSKITVKPVGKSSPVVVTVTVIEPVVGPVGGSLSLQAEIVTVARMSPTVTMRLMFSSRIEFADEPEES